MSTLSPMSRTDTLRDEVRQLGALAWPIALAQFGLMAMSLVDTAVLGRVSSTDLAAAALGRNIGFSTQTLTMGLAMGLEPLASQAVGANRPERAWHALMATLRTIGIAWFPTVLAAFAYTLVLPYVGASAEVIHRTRLFLLAWAPGLFAFPCFIAAKTYLQAHGRTRPALVAAAVANVINFAVCNLLVRGDDALAAVHLPGVGLPRLGALGSGIALSVSGAILCVIVLRGAWALRPRERARDAVSAREVLRYGLPVGAQLLAEIGVFALVSVLSGRFGDAGVSANQIALGLASFTFMGALGVSGATAVRVGNALGAGKNARRPGLTGIALGALVMCAGVVVFTAAPAVLVRVFTHDPEIVALGTLLVRVAALFQLFDGMQCVGAGALRGAGDVRFAFGAGVVSYWIIGLPLALLFAFPLHRGVLGLWWGLSASLVAAALLFLVRFWIITAEPRRETPLAHRAAEY